MTITRHDARFRDFLPAVCAMIFRKSLFFDLMLIRYLRRRFTTIIFIHFFFFFSFIFVSCRFSDFAAIMPFDFRPFFILMPYRAFRHYFSCLMSPYCFAVAVADHILIFFCHACRL